MSFASAPPPLRHVATPPPDAASRLRVLLTARHHACAPRGRAGTASGVRRGDMSARKDGAA